MGRQTGHNLLVLGEIWYRERQAEEHPVTFYYSEEGTKLTLPASVRSSHEAGPNFVPPPQEPAGPSRRSRPQARSESPTYESASQARAGKGREYRSSKSALPPVIDAADEATFHKTYLGAKRDPPHHLPSAPTAAPLYNEAQGAGSYPARRTADTSGQNASGRQGAGAGGAGDPPGSDRGAQDRSPWDESRNWRGPPPRRREGCSPPRGDAHPDPALPDPSEFGDDGPSSSSSSSWGGRSDHCFPYIAPGAPYGTMVPTIDPKLKLEALPEWDGNHDTAIDYFWEVYQIASLLGWLPRTLGFWLPTRLVKDSQVYLWFSTLPTARQSEMRSHYLMNNQYEQQTFRQIGHEKESPQSFLGRRVRYTRLLTVTDDRGPDEVQQIMRTAPIAWSSILIVENVRSVEDLYERINEHEEELVDVVARRQLDVLTTGNITSILRRLGFSQNSQATYSAPRRERRVNITEADTGAVGGESEADPALESLSPPEFGEEEHTMRSVYQTLARPQRPPPKGGYPFKKNDHVTTKMGRDPPSPCKSVLSPGREHKPASSKLQLGNGYIAQDTRLEEEDEQNLLTHRRQAMQVQIEEVEDEYWHLEASMPKARFALIQDADPVEVGKVEEESEEIDEEESWKEVESVKQASLPPPPVELEPIVIYPRRNPKPGDSALGERGIRLEDRVEELAVRGTSHWSRALSGSSRSPLFGYRFDNPCPFGHKGKRAWESEGKTAASGSESWCRGQIRASVPGLQSTGS
ncbi:hypothetical protein DFH08DRAFT_942785 [Mycena albidolilacea]|uniref:Uncharacterized protein n=1 Tax=Mycena albidolilacea TaxID=1033008 RepID=A0AAD6ZD07_9AGAR|nr:hypothetical protein DFH08DRAFT_942785 [Mycena albidolilacea]